MDVDGEWIGRVGYLVESRRITEATRDLAERTTWEVEKPVRIGMGQSLAVFTRPHAASRDDAPSTEPDWMAIVVSLDRYANHISDYGGAGWMIGSEGSWEDGFRSVCWLSPCLDRLIAEEERATALARYSPPPYLAPSVLGSGLYLGGT